MLIFLFGTVCLLVFIAAFIGGDFVSFSYIQRLFMASTPVLFFAVLFVEIISGLGISLKLKGS